MKNPLDDPQPEAQSDAPAEASSRFALLKILFAIWTVLQAIAIAYPAMSPETGDGFTRGLNRIGDFLAFQGVAGVLAVLLVQQAYHYRKTLPKLWRILTAVPIVVTLLLLLSLIGIIVAARFQ